MTPFDRRLVSKTLSRIACATPEDILQSAEPESRVRTRVIGITGAPGVGKSTLINQLAAQRLQRASSLAVLAIDPTSPHSQGSLLGDRVRMDTLSDDPRVFIRSLPSGGSEDGLTQNLADVVSALAQFGFEEVIIETVGVGQTGYGVRALADAEVVVLTPGAGDYVQAMKGGLLETADIYVVNKADLPGADRLVGELLSVLRPSPDSSSSLVLQLQTGDNTGIAQLSAALDRWFAASPNAESAHRLERARRRYRVHQLVQRQLQQVMSTLPESTWDLGLQETYRRVLHSLCKPCCGGERRS